MKKLLLFSVLLLLPLSGLFADDAVDGLSARQLLVQARGLFPHERMQVIGTLATAEARGLNEQGRPYVLNLDWRDGSPRVTCDLYRTPQDKAPILRAELTRKAGVPSLALTDSNGTRTDNIRLNTPIGESDLTWMDLAFDYLWWPDATRLSDEQCDQLDIPRRTGGRSCTVVEARPPDPVPGLSAVRLWIDRSTGNLLQTEQLGEDGRTTRQMFVQRIGREEGRWVPREFRVRRTGLNRVTKLYIDSIITETFSTEGNAQ